MDVVLIVRHYVVPAFGVAIANIMNFSPTHAVLDAQRTRSLGDLDPLPYTFILANCLAKVGYSFAVKNWFMFFSNGPGVLASLFFILTVYGFAPFKTRLLMMLSTLSCLTANGLLGICLTNLAVQQDLVVSIWGWFSVMYYILFYMSPLNKVRRVFTEKNAVYISLPLNLTALVNALLWTAYGLVLWDAFVWVPAAVGGGFSVFQLSLKLLLPSRPGLDPRVVVVKRASVLEAKGLLSEEARKRLRQRQVRESFAGLNSAIEGEVQRRLLEALRSSYTERDGEGGADSASGGGDDGEGSDAGGEWQPLAGGAVDGKAPAGLGSTKV